MFRIQFLGGAETVTGSKYLVSFSNMNILVDCGLFQGLKSLRLKNWDKFQIDPGKIDAVLLTHAHIDHSGYIPRLIENGFKGRIYATEATYDLCKILLPDAGYLAEEEAEYLNKHKKTKHNPALPLFTVEQAHKSLDFFEVVDFEKKVVLGNGIEFEFRYSGHILGAASVLIKLNDMKLFFTGDVGRPDSPVFFEPRNIPHIDYLITESTYGNRRHNKSDVLDELEKIINDTFKKGGVVLIPTFAVGRAQEIMYYLWQLKIQHRIPDIPMYLNSPMAMNVNSIFVKYHHLHRLNKIQSEDIYSVVKYIHSVEESKALNEKKGSMLIISASGMLTGGRVLHHLKKFGPVANNTILLTGFQAMGTRGEALKNGVDELKIHGEYIPIKCDIQVLENMSAHADYQEIINWFRKSDIKPKKTFIVHGEPAALDSLRMRISDLFGWSCVVPELNEIFELDIE